MADTTSEAINKMRNRPCDLFWLLRGDRSVASSRFQGYLIHHQLVRSARGAFKSRILLAPPHYLASEPWTSVERDLLASASRGAIVVLQKMFGPTMAALPHLIREAGGKTVFVHCDYEPDNEIPMACDVVVTPSTALAAEYVARGCRQVVVIPDPAEIVWPTPVAGSKDTTFLTIGWIGSSGNWKTLDDLRAILSEDEFDDFRLVTVSDHPNADERWSLRAVARIMPRFDLAVVPVGSTNQYRVKSANRVALFMAAGVPVIAGRIPAYESVIAHGENGLLFSNREELRDCLRGLRSASKRRTVSSAAFEMARTQFTVAETTRRWRRLLEELAQNLQTPTRQVAARKRQCLTELEWHSSLAMLTLAIRSGKRSRAVAYVLKALAVAMRSPSPGRLRDVSTLAYRYVASRGRRVKSMVQSLPNR
jgi:hypothetical protein